MPCLSSPFWSKTICSADDGEDSFLWIDLPVRFTNASIITHNQCSAVQCSSAVQTEFKLSSWVVEAWYVMEYYLMDLLVARARWNKWISNQSSSNKAHLSRFIHSVSYFQQQLDIGSRSNWGFDGVVWCKGGSYANRGSWNIITVGCWAFGVGIWFEITEESYNNLQSIIPYTYYRINDYYVLFSFGHTFICTCCWVQYFELVPVCSMCRRPIDLNFYKMSRGMQTANKIDQWSAIIIFLPTFNHAKTCTPLFLS